LFLPSFPCYFPIKTGNPKMALSAKSGTLVPF